MIYSVPSPNAPLTQGDVLGECPVFGYPTSTGVIDPSAPPTRWSERVLVLTQACDLAQAKTSEIVVALVQPAQRLVELGVLKAATIRDRVRRGLIYGW